MHDIDLSKLVAILRLTANENERLLFLQAATCREMCRERPRHGGEGAGCRADGVENGIITSYLKSNPTE